MKEKFLALKVPRPCPLVLLLEEILWASKALGNEKELDFVKCRTEK
jgi:hypothetical protein